jgi:hypothetical protein
MRVQLRTFLVLVVVLVLGLPAAANAGWKDVIRDCAVDGRLDKHYSLKEYRDALKHLPSDFNEYTDCAAAIHAAMTGGSGRASGPANGIMTPSGSAVAIGGHELLPGDVGGLLGAGAGANGMPASLIAAIAALVVLAVVSTYFAAREKLPLVRRVALRIFSR